MSARRSHTSRFFLAGMLALCLNSLSMADDKAVIDANTARALSWIRTAGGDSAALLQRAAGVLVFPDMVKMGFGVGGEFGEGTLLVGGETVDYYATAGTTFGHLPDAEYKAEVIFFMTEEALQSFRDTHSWKVGEHATVAMLTDVTAGGAVSASSPAHIGLIFSEDGPVSGLGFDGVRVTRISR
jgi:lipid-binding SYLF domain-containing protein